MDIMSKERRSRLMGRVKTRDTAPELALRKALWTAGLRYRLRRTLPGSPDIVFVSAKIAVFVDGCFWHGCPHWTKPGTNQQFWVKKIKTNQERDARNVRDLGEMGWHALRVWEHQIEEDLPAVVREIERLVS